MSLICLYMHKETIGYQKNIYICNYKGKTDRRDFFPTYILKAYGVIT